MNMLMARQYDVDVATREGVHCKTCPADDAIVGFEIQSLERMMGDDYPGNVIGQMCEFFSRRPKLTEIDPAILDCQGSGRVDPDDSDFTIGVERICVRLDVAHVPRQRREGTGKDIPERYIMVARNHKARARKGVEERSRLQEFMFAGALRQIPGNDQQIWSDCAHLRSDGLHKLAVCFSEMQIRKMDECPHQIAPASGAVADRTRLGGRKNLQRRWANAEFQGHVHMDGFAIQRDQHGGSMRRDLQCFCAIQFHVAS